MLEIEEIKNKVINSDCLDILKELPDKSIDLTITSPPYNMGGKSLGYKPRSKVSDKHYDVYNDNLEYNEYKIKMFDILKLCISKSRYVFWNIQFLTSTRDFIIDMMSEFRNELKDIFIWNKQAIPQISNNNYSNHGMATGFEFVFIFGEDNNSRQFGNLNFPKNGYVPNIMTWYKKESFENHSATFPVELPHYFVKHFSKENDIILDPFLGSGTTAIACKLLNRNFIGIEISEEYCKLAEARIRKVSNQLFT